MGHEKYYKTSYKNKMYIKLYNIERIFGKLLS